MEKSGSSHVEMVLAFILFIAAIIFILTFFDIGGTTIKTDSSEAYFYNELIQATKQDVKIYTFQIKQETIESENPWPSEITITLPEPIGANEKVRAEDKDGTKMTSTISSDRTQISLTHDNKEYVKIIVSEGIKG